MKRFPDTSKVDSNGEQGDNLPNNMEEDTEKYLHSSAGLHKLYTRSHYEEHASDNTETDEKYQIDDKDDDTDEGLALSTDRYSSKCENKELDKDKASEKDELQDEKEINIYNHAKVNILKNRRFKKSTIFCFLYKKLEIKKPDRIKKILVPTNLGKKIY